MLRVLILCLLLLQTVCAHSFRAKEGQDKFVYMLLNGQKEGAYLEIGADHPEAGNNSFFFEKDLQWKGVSLEISSAYQNVWKWHRKNPLIIADATKSDYKELLKDLPKTIDYLSLDVDGPYIAVLEQMPLDEYRFKVITIEHDAYRFGNVHREKEREILSALGYQLICADVCYAPGQPFEDWWIDPAAFPQNVGLIRFNHLHYPDAIKALKQTLKCELEL